MAVQLNLVKVTLKSPELWSNDWILYHDSAPADKALSVKQFLAQKSITEMEHSPCSHSQDGLDVILTLNSQIRRRLLQCVAQRLVTRLCYFMRH